MNRITQLDPTDSTGKTKDLFDSVQKKLGVVPNLMRVLGNAPAALDGYLAFSGALAQGSFNARLREQIALTVAEVNLCNYCLSAHTYIGARAGLDADAIESARRASSQDPRTDAVLKFARSIVLRRGEVVDGEIAAARKAGLSDTDLVETVTNVALNLFTNYVNHVARTVVDFPAVEPLAAHCTTGACSNA